MSFRIAVFTASFAPHVARTLALILEREPDAEVRVLLHAPPRPLKRLLRSQRRNFARHGLRWLPYQSAEIAGQLRAKIARRGRPSPPLAGVASRAETVLADPRVTLETVASINAGPVAARLRAFAPDLGLSLAAPILKPALFEVPRLGTLNIHKGRLPDYRGMPPAFWEMWDGAADVGVTVHRVEAGLDTGAILLEDRVPIERFSTPGGLRARLDERGAELMAEAVGRMRADTAEFTAQPPGGRTRSRPTLAQEAALQQRVAPAPPRDRFKAAAFAALGTLRRTTSAQRETVAVLLYHRVNDALRDNVTIGVQQFDEHMRYLADHYRVARFEDVLVGDLPDDGPIVAVTFDDGYLDNYEQATPILLKHGVHATFFVSTDNVGHNLPFAHDLSKLGRGLPAMTWDQARAMAREGLGFGSHTAKHINLARTDAAIVEEELRTSKAAVERELGLDRVLFAYPFGKRADITAERLGQVRAAGYAGNASAYGGLNRRGAIDPWDVRRFGVDHTYSVSAIAARIAGWGAGRLV